uniref:Uncharacterized protein n=1 Tax=Haemonchus contortus TaxID=6289 RepID=A0A7I4YEG9_HAECO
MEVRPLKTTSPSKRGPG